MARVKSPPPASLFAWAGVAAPEPTPVVTLVAEPVVATDEDVEAFAIIEPETEPEPEPEVIAVIVPFPELPTTLAEQREGTTVAVVKDIRGEWWIHRHRGDASMSQQLWTRDELTSLRDRIVAWAIAEGV